MFQLFLILFQIRGPLKNNPLSWVLNVHNIENIKKTILVTMLNVDYWTLVNWQSLVSLALTFEINDCCCFVYVSVKIVERVKMPPNWAKVVVIERKYLLIKLLIFYCIELFPSEHTKREREREFRYYFHIFCSNLHLVFNTIYIYQTSDMYSLNTVAYTSLCPGIQNQFDFIKYSVRKN